MILTTDGKLRQTKGRPEREGLAHKRPVSFRWWLSRRRRDDNLIGDFAYFVLQAPRFRSPRSWKALEDYLYFEAPDLLRSNAAIRAGRLAWDAYRAEYARVAPKGEVAAE
jgi:hypothetical protein